ncbi:AMP-binding protein [Paracoccus sp. TK19116]|uniref:AMP-binding protein n=1 Tax=Paracoccus albicereus TaxID=2922394 RepID=A0ABT1MPE2_9RHOB|nr:AMP-binding protein [Paracoccus albicereus]MCQ0970152.1 AMP-binding protein [Paracoccus albicereus]
MLGNIFSSSSSVPCSPNQERYLLASLGGQQSYYLPLTFQLPADVSVSCLRRSIELIVANTGGLDAAFEHQGSGRFTWRPVGARALFFRQISAQDEAQAVADATLFVHGGPGPLKEAPCKLHIAYLSTGGHLLTLALHHAVADAVSLGLIVDRISAAYNTRRQNGASRALSTATGDTSHIRADPATASDLTYWRQALAKADDAGGLWPRRPAPENETGTRNELCRLLDPASLKRLSAAARTAGVTTFEATFAAYLLVLSRQTGRSAACATFQSAGRRAHPERQFEVGVFSNALPTLIHPDPNASFADHARAVRHAVRSALQHEAMPYHEIIRETGVHPRYGINWYPRVEALEIEGVRLPGDRRVGWQSDFDLNLHALRTEEGLRLSLSYPATRLHGWRAEVVLDHVAALLEGEVLTNPQALREIELPGARLDITTCAPEAEPDQSLSDHVAQIARDAPDRCAIVATDGELSYGALMRDVDALAKELVVHGAQSGQALAIELPRGPAIATAILAADRVGMVFAVYDPDYPANRRTAMDDALRPTLRLRPIEDSDGPGRASPAPCSRIELASGRVSLVEAGTSAPITPLPRAARYALFTSGTTGRPKCVVADGRGLHRFLNRTREERTITHDDRFALLGGLGHDPMLRDLLLPLTSGATLHVPSEETRRNPYELFDWLAAARPTLLNLTPQMARVIGFGAGGRTLPSLRHVTFGGDMLGTDVVSTIRALAPIAAVSNLYGATETPQAASLYDLSGTQLGSEATDQGSPSCDWDVCPIGTSAGSRRLVLERDGQPAAPGEPAEIVVEGDDLALGYYNAADGRLPSISLGTGLPRRHRTGDLGLRIPSGEIFLLGRADDQVKIRGFRVEPAEISRHLESHTEISQAITIARPGATGDTELVAYVVPSTAEPDRALPTGAELLESCRRNLPAAMVPRAVLLIDRLPITPNGKIDRAALPGPDMQVEAEPTDRPDDAHGYSERAQELAAMVAQVLGRQTVSPAARVHDLDVDSLSYLSVSLALEAHLGALPKNWETRPLHALAELGEVSKVNRVGPLGMGWPRHFRMVETPVLMRAISIAAVVAGHFGLIAFGGATSALFFIAGHSFGRFQMPAILRRDGVGPIISLVSLIALPTILYSLLLQTVFTTPEPLTLLLLGNMLGPHVVSGFSFWFVDVLVQCLLVLAAVLAFPPSRRAIRSKPFECACLAVVASVALRYALGAIWDTSSLFDRVVHEKLWLVVLGWCLAQATTGRQQLIATLLVAGVLGLDTFVHGTPRPLTTAAFVIILTVSRLPMPTILAIAVTRVAAGSLFIYLTHFQFKSVIADLLPPSIDPSALGFALAIMGGVAIHVVWEKAFGITRGLVRRRGTVS